MAKEKKAKTNTETPHPKKEMRKQLAAKLKAAVPELATLIGDKKLDSRIKKAAKLLSQGVHKQEATGTVKKAALKKAALQKAAVQKVAVQTVAKPKAVQKTNKN